MSQLSSLADLGSATGLGTQQGQSAAPGAGIPPVTAGGGAWGPNIWGNHFFKIPYKIIF